MEAATCAQFINEGTEVAQAIPEFATAEIKRLKPQMEQLQKQIEEEMQNPSEEVKKDLEQLRQDLRDRQEELQREIKHWVKESDI